MTKSRKNSRKIVVDNEISTDPKNQNALDNLHSWSQMLHLTYRVFNMMNTCVPSQGGPFNVSTHSENAEVEEYKGKCRIFLYNDNGGIDNEDRSTFVEF